MQKNKYLDELGIPIERYGVNWRDDCSYYEQQREEYGFDQREIYDVDVIFAEWLYSHLKMYLEVAGKDLNLNSEDEDRLIEFGNGCYTISGAIDYILERLERHLTIEEENPTYQDYKEALHMWAEVAMYIWW